MIWNVPADSPVLDSLEPGTWALNPDLTQDLARYINQELNDVVALQERYDSWSELPLIVLAGLR